MAVSQRIIFSAIPNGFQSGTAFVNLHISPRLATDDPAAADLTRFRAWRDWASTINAATIRVLVDGVPIDSHRLERAQPPIWSALFPDRTVVQTHGFQDLRGHDVLTYPMAELAAAIEADYVKLAGMDAEQLPTAQSLARLISYRPRREMNRDQVLQRLRLDDGPIPMKDRGLGIAMLAAYHRPLNQEEIMIARPDADDDGQVNAEYVAHKRGPMPSAAELAGQFDFHKIVAALGQHPSLMKACGLVVPLSVRLDDLPTGDFGLSVEVDWETGDIATEPDIRPVTRARRDARDFRPRPRDPQLLSGGWLKMNKARFGLVTMDVDGAGLSLKNMAINLPNMREERYDDEAFDADRQARTGTPRIRTAGIQLAHSRRDVAIRAAFAGSGKLNDVAMAGGVPVLFAEDLIRGWRADVGEERSGRWQSLLRFDGRYELLNAGETLHTVDEETVLKLAAGKASDGGNPTLLKASEALFAWSGWSLAAPPPGHVILPDDKSHDEAPNTVPDGLPLKVTPKAHQNSLPLLRFGRTYRVRMRYADLAGGGVGWSPDPAPLAGVDSEPYFFGRYEPVEAPTVTIVEGDPLPKDGESMARAALRTMDDPAKNDPAARRNLVPPRIGIRFAELHGVLDRNNRPDPDKYQLLADRDSNYPETLVAGLIFDPHDPGGPGKPYDTKYATGRHAAATPYLYDPLAAGVALRISGVPGISPDTIWRVPFTGDSWNPSAPIDWPDGLGFSLAASETVATGWDPADRTFTVQLAQGERARVRVSALVPKKEARFFKLLERLEAAAAGGDPDQVTRYKLAVAQMSRGQHWMFTPWRSLELVHALQRPLVAPVYQSLNAFRGRDEVAAEIVFATPIHAKSTVRIDTDAVWKEIDDHSSEGPEIRDLKTDAFNHGFARLDWPENKASRLLGKQVFNDTRARFVGYRMRATTRFREFMPPDIRKDPDAIDQVSERQSVWVPASSPPAAPVILYVVPSFGWFESGSPGTEQRSWREGGGLRVYLDRPWYSSGSNEMLAVLLPMATDVPKNGALRDYVSQWGADTVWAGPKVTTVAPRRTDLRGRVDHGPVPYDFGTPDPVDIPDGAFAGSSFPLISLRPQGAPDDVQVEAVPHAVGYDRDRKLWYCDILVRPGGAYQPFIRLALARYQPHAIQGCELSSVAMASFQQLSPDRVATVAAAGLLARGRRVSIYGRLPSNGFAFPSAGNIQVRLQRLKSGANPELDWEDTAHGPMPEGGPVIGSHARLGASRSFAIPRDALTQAQRALIRESEKISGSSVIGQVRDKPDLFELLLPPLIHEEIVVLPDHGQDRLRLLITETEAYWTEDAGGRRSAVPAERIVYAATIEM